MKTVKIVAHEFAGLPGHMSIEVEGSGSNLGVAIRRAVMAVFRDGQVKRRRVSEFKMSVAVVQLAKESQ